MHVDKHTTKTRLICGFNFWCIKKLTQMTNADVREDLENERTKKKQNKKKESREK